MRVLEVTEDGRELARPALQLELLLQRVGKPVLDRSWTLLRSRVTGLWSMDIDGDPVLTDVPLGELLDAI